MRSSVYIITHESVNALITFESYRGVSSAQFLDSCQCERSVAVLMLVLAHTSEGIDLFKEYLKLVFIHSEYKYCFPSVLYFLMWTDHAADILTDDVTKN